MTATASRSFENGCIENLEGPCPNPLLQTLCLSNIMFARHQVALVIPSYSARIFPRHNPRRKAGPDFVSILSTRLRNSDMPSFKCFWP
jgi:hypothetical protein